ncbi:VOC family protein [bacterium]|nr:VOC family protein [bacterium]RQV94330.1 MAG: VOC family protein [bacterium]
MRAKYKHINIIARDWQKLAAFYEQVFSCIRVPPERHLSGKWLEEGTGVANARFSGVHLRLPGDDDCDLILEIFQYSENKPKSPPAANREGFCHIAFEVDDVRLATEAFLKNGGSPVGKPVSADIPGIGKLTFVYLADPEGNIVELQAWK